MKKCIWFCSLVVCGLFCVTTPLAFAVETSTRAYPLSDHGSLRLEVPTAWADQVRQPSGQLPPTVIFSQKTGASFNVLITPLWAANRDTILPDGQKLKQMVQQSAEQAKTQAVEKTIERHRDEGDVGYRVLLLCNRSESQAR